MEVTLNKLRTARRMKYVSTLFKILHPLNECFEAISLHLYDLLKVKATP